MFWIYNQKVVASDPTKCDPWNLAPGCPASYFKMKNSYFYIFIFFFFRLCSPFISHKLPKMYIILNEQCHSNKACPDIFHSFNVSVFQKNSFINSLTIKFNYLSNLTTNKKYIL